MILIGLKYEPKAEAVAKAIHNVRGIVMREVPGAPRMERPQGVRARMATENGARMATENGAKSQGPGEQVVKEREVCFKTTNFKGSFLQPAVLDEI